MNSPSIIHAEVHFISSVQSVSSIRIGVANVSSSIFVNDTRFVHLPPLQRLKEPHQVFESIKSSTRHRIEYDTSTSNEPIITKVDGIDITSLWEFLEAKKVNSSSSASVSKL